jgi:long-chain acyl-CoA synthetase
MDESGLPLAPGNLGEICIRGPQVMKGYWNQPAETADVLRGGWLHSGDIGVIDERGYLTLLDRKKDVIVVSGFKVFPNEVEEVVTMHAGVLKRQPFLLPTSTPDRRSRSSLCAATRRSLPMSSLPIASAT